MIKNYKFENLKDLSNELDKLKFNDDTIFNKEIFGEVFTPFSLILDMFKTIPDNVFLNPNLKWMDPGSGIGNFSIILYFKLFESLSSVIDNEEQRKDHIINNMLYMIEIRKENINILKLLFGNKANIYELNFLEDIQSYIPQKFDMIIGNPPFNCNGIIKVPTKKNFSKKEDGKTIWSFFIKKSISLLKEDTGKLCIFIPSIWLKPDKEKMYNFLTQFKIEYLTCFSNIEIKKIFKGKAQTPCCYFLLTNKNSDNIINIFEKQSNEYIDFKLNIKKEIPIPLCNIKIINILLDYCYKYKNIDVIKTNLPSKNIIISSFKNKDFIFSNISTCLIKRNGENIIPNLVINYSNKAMIGYGKEKLILANKMYGIPILDLSGIYGISNRDNYIIYKNNIDDLIKLYNFLSTKLVQIVFNTTRYRMMYLEKYAFQFLPDITLIPDFPKIINDFTVNEFFNIN